MKNKLTNDKFLIAEIHYEVFFCQQQMRQSIQEWTE